MVTYFNIVGLLVIFVINLSIVFVFSATTTVVTLNSTFFEITFHLRHESSVLAV